MSSLVWRMSAQEAWDSPYEYEVREQFFREAKSLLNHLYLVLNADPFQFTIDNRSVEKAVWLLHMDVQDSLRESLCALERKEHRIASKLFRIAFEALDLAAYFHSRNESSRSDLDSWYEGEVVPHKRWRQHLQSVGQPEEARRRSQLYKRLSRHVHRTYPILLYSYSAGGKEGNFMVHDGTQAVFSERGFDARDFLVHPQVISLHCSTLADFISLASQELVIRELASAEEIEDAIEAALEVDTVPRRFKLPGQFRKSQ